MDSYYYFFPDVPTVKPPAPVGEAAPSQSAHAGPPTTTATEAATDERELVEQLPRTNGYAPPKEVSEARAVSCVIKDSHSRPADGIS